MTLIGLLGWTIECCEQCQLSIHLFICLFFALWHVVKIRLHFAHGMVCNLYGQWCQIRSKGTKANNNQSGSFTICQSFLLKFLYSSQFSTQVLYSFPSCFSHRGFFSPSCRNLSKKWNKFLTLFHQASWLRIK